MKRLIAIFSNVKVVLIAVAVIAVVALVLWTARTVSRSEVAVVSDKRIDITPEQIRSIKAIGEWEFLSIADEEMVDTLRRGLFGDDRLVRIYYGTLRLGINLHKAAPGWIRASGDTVVVKLPPVELLDNDFIDEARTRSFYESGRWTPADREAMYMRAHRMMRQHCLTPANLRSARNNADAQMRRVLRSMGFVNVVVEFAE